MNRKCAAKAGRLSAIGATNEPSGHKSLFREDSWIRHPMTSALRVTRAAFTRRSSASTTAESASTTRGWRGSCRSTRNGRPWLSRKPKATSSKTGKSSTRHRERRSNCALQSDEEESDEREDDRHRNRRAG